jgi:hypothetical protein
MALRARDLCVIAPIEDNMCSSTDEVVRKAETLSASLSRTYMLSLAKGDPGCSTFSSGLAWRSRS